jgi:hypothetical protein
MHLFFKKHGIAIALCFFSFLLLGYFTCFNEYADGGADNYWHYFFSRYAFQYPQLFLNHWGKPLFILLSSPFAQFGFLGLTLFNIICGIATAIITYKFALALRLRHSWLVILLLIFTPLYFLVLQSGLTEPLMSLLLITVFYLLFTGKFFWATLLMSFSLYTRTEGLFLTLYVMLYLVFIQQWKYLPVLFIGFIVYSVVGWLAGHHFFWYFTENPYSPISPYGHGSWKHFFYKYDFIWGLPLSIFMVLGLVLVFIQSFKKIKEMFSGSMPVIHKTGLLVVAPMVIFFMFHLISWTFGLFGSLGLERVLACVSPFCALIACMGFHYFLEIKWINRFTWPLMVVFSFIMVLSTFKRHHYPLKARGGAKVVLEIAQWFKTVDPHCRVYYADPALIFNTQRNPFDTTLNHEEFGFDPGNIPTSPLPTYVFWDSKLSAGNCGLHLSTLEAAPNLVKIKELEDRGYRMVVFQLK